MEHQSLMVKHYTDKLKEKYEDRKTKCGGTIDLCIKSGVACPESSVGIYATDAEAYDLFGELFYEIIKERHRLDDGFNHPAPDFGDPKAAILDLKAADTENWISSTRIRVGRSLKGYPYSPIMTKEQRLDLQDKVIGAMKCIPGKYIKITDLSKEEYDDLVHRHILYRDDDDCLRAAGSYEDWPHGRGIFTSDDGKVHVWCGEEDHVRIISMDEGADVPTIYSRLIEAVKAIEDKNEFDVHEKYGNLTVCPSNLGTALRGSVLMCLPRLSELKHFKELCGLMGLDVRGSGGEHTKSDGRYDISNKARLGLTEFQAVSMMCKGVKCLIGLEKELQELIK